MADPAVKEESGWTMKGALSSAFTTIVSTNPLTAPTYWAVQALSGGTQSMQANALQTMDNPSEQIMAKLAGAEAFKGTDGQEALAKIQGDKAFMAALDKAVQTDKSVAPGLLEIANGDGSSGLNAEKVAALLADEKNRGVMTQVLDKVGENNNDKFNFAYMMRVGTAGAEGDIGKVQTILAEGGMQNDDVDLGADPTKLFGLAMNDPKAFGTKMSKFMGFEGEQGKSMASLFETLGKLLQMIMGSPSDPNSISYFMDKHGAGIQQGFENITGITDQKRADAKAENPDIKVADSKRPTADFNNSAANDTKDTPAPAQEPGFMERYAEAQVTAAKYGALAM